MKVQWHWLKDNDFPKNGQNVFGIYKGIKGEYRRWEHDLKYYKDLYALDKYDFPEYKNKHQDGFVYLDATWGWIEYTNIVAWCEMPDLPEYVEGEN